MSWEALQAHVHPGDGVVANFGSAVVVLLPRPGRHESAVEEILAIVAAAGGQGQGRRLARRLAGFLASAEPEDVPAFGVLAETGDGAAVIVHGAVDLEVTSPKGTSMLSGREAATWVDRIVAAPFDSLALVPSGSPRPAADPRSDLRSGTVRGGGVLLRSRTSVLVAPTPPPPPPHPADGAPSTRETPVTPELSKTPPVPFDAEGTRLAPVIPAVPATEPEPAREFVSISFLEPEPAEELPPLPIVEDVPEAVEPEGPTVQGISCSRTHLNDPNSLFCSSCGISMVQQTHNLIRGPRPPLGVLVLDDGAAFILDGDYVIGREPDADTEVQSGRARPLALADPERTISRAHARVALQGWDVRVLDLDSANGTYLAEPGATEWTRLPAHEARTIRPGTRILVGQRPLVYESHHRT
ncbi:MAG: FHA domain-containing protein [Acidimicrobiales bacterium]